MKELVVISGKGGTGKTSIVASFAALAKNAVFADCDVDAADLHLVLEPDIKQTNDFSGGKRASVITEKCIGCGRCKEVCNFNAAALEGPANNLIEKTFKIDPVACEGCGVCVHSILLEIRGVHNTGIPWQKIQQCCANACGCFLGFVYAV